MINFDPSAYLPLSMESTLWPQNKYYPVKALVGSSYEATAVSEPSSALRSTRAYSSVLPCAPSPARHTGFLKAEKIKPTVYPSITVSHQCVTLLTICVRWCSLSKRFLPVSARRSFVILFRENICPLQYLFKGGTGCSCCQA